MARGIVMRKVIFNSTGQRKHQVEAELIDSVSPCTDGKAKSIVVLTTGRKLYSSEGVFSISNAVKEAKK